LKSKNVRAICKVKPFIFSIQKKVFCLRWSNIILPSFPRTRSYYSDRLPENGENVSLQDDFRNRWHNFGKGVTLFSFFMCNFAAVYNNKKKTIIIMYMKRAKQWMTILGFITIFLTLLPTIVFAQSSFGITINMADDNPPTNGTGWTYAGGIYTILHGANVIVTGDNQSPIASQRRIAVEAGATVTITLSGVSITGLGNNQSPLLLNVGADVTLILADGTTNTLSAGVNCAGIQTTGATLTIEAESPGTGTLTATGDGGGAGIGGEGGSSGGAGGNITINGGNVTANGGSGSDGGAGIGGGSSGSSGGAGGNITINGGNVIANGGSGSGGSGAGIGGGGGNTGGAGGNIIINDGDVTAKGGNGSGGGSSGAGIGGGGSNTGGVAGGSGGTVNITGGTVEATGGQGTNFAGGGAGIGGGAGGGGGNGGPGGNSGNISITGNAIVTATGGAGGTANAYSTAGSGGAGIGSGGAGCDAGAGDLGTIVITTTGTVTAKGGDGGSNNSAGPPNYGYAGGGGAGIGTGGAGQIGSSGDLGTIITVGTINVTGGIGGTSTNGNIGYSGATIGAGGSSGVGAQETFHTITATANSGGSISPSGAVQVNDGSDITFTITPNIDFAITSVEVDGTNDPVAVSSGNYTFTNVTNNHAITAAFKAITSLTLSASPNGSQTYPGDVILTAILSGAVPANSGMTITFTVNGAMQTAVTNASGVATCILTSPATGTFTFGASFAGDANNNAASATNITGYTVSNPSPLIAPHITGPTSMSLTEGYTATSTDAFTITGTAPVSITKTSGDDRIIWNSATKKLDIAAGLPAGV
jgi:hypothetical protein